MHVGSVLGMNEAVGFAERSPPLPPSPSAREPWVAKLHNGRQDDAVNQNGEDFGLEEAVTHEVEVDGVAWTSVVGHPSQGPGSSREFAYTCDFVLFGEDPRASGGDGASALGASPLEALPVDALGRPLAQGYPQLAFRDAEARANGYLETGQISDPQAIARIGTWDENRDGREALRVPASDFDRELDRSLSSQGSFGSHLGGDESQASTSTGATFCACCECAEVDFNDSLAMNWAHEGPARFG
ncbi:hypothetical protein VFPBJ_08974 [Purpureocillium lilacinum]|uniref:Uncharacterized protein n=1 Tax=Purpureocillium lilacinum TaxID=33203 RepID=A0A179GFJ4_PURLI|nr:hypothetical protein VFPBJ_08974 [Purpureocillium lilacinum]